MSKAGNTLHAFDFLKSSESIDKSVIVVFGDDAFLKGQVNERIRRTLLGGDDDDINLVKLAGSQTSYSEVADELHTISLFGGNKPRVVLLTDAENFVSDNRDRLESLVTNQDASGVLVLEVVQWRSNTRLYKNVDKLGLQIDCRAPLRGKSIDSTKIAKWASAWGKSQHGIKIKPIVIEHMIDLTGTELGVLNQNLAKLSLYFDSKTEITEDAIDEYIGGWQTKTIWQIIDSVINGHTGPALTQLDRLFQNGEVPQSLFGQISWAIRRFAMAFDEAQRYRRHGKKLNVDDVIGHAGFRPFEKKKAVEQLGKIGREKGAEYYRLLLDCDLALKSSHSTPARGRIALERLVLALLELKTGKKKPNLN